MPKNNRNNKQYTKEQREAMVIKLLPPNNLPITTLSNESGIPKTTLCDWKSKAITGVTSGIKVTRKAMTSANKFHIILETYILSEYDLSKYCRAHGLYVDEVKKWRLNFESSLNKEPNEVREAKEELLEEKKKNKILEKDLHRKDKALAEAAALLVLQKKFRAFMEVEEI